MVLETFRITKRVCWFHFEKILLNEYEVQQSSNEANFLTDVFDCKPIQSRSYYLNKWSYFK